MICMQARWGSNSSFGTHYNGLSTHFSKANQKLYCYSPLAANRTTNRTPIRAQNYTCRRPLRLQKKGLGDPSFLGGIFSLNSELLRTMCIVRPPAPTTNNIALVTLPFTSDQSRARTPNPCSGSREQALKLKLLKVDVHGNINWSLVFG
jgi:hypothetical protein